MKTVGVILAGGNGSRLAPLTHTINKHLLPVCGEPMVHWPISALATLGIEDVIVVLGGKSCGNLIEHFGSVYETTYLNRVGKPSAVRLSYVYQKEAGGIPDAYLAAAPLLELIGADRAVIILGDNIFPHGFTSEVAEQIVRPGENVASVVSKIDMANGAENYGCVPVLPRDGAGGPIPAPRFRLVEKPRKSPYEYDSSLDGYVWSAVLGVYSLPFAESIKIARTLRPSGRGELEIVDLLQEFGNRKKLVIANHTRRWIDSGDPFGYRLSNDEEFWV